MAGETCSSAILSITEPTWPNPDRGGMTATNCLSYFKAEANLGNCESCIIAVTWSKPEHGTYRIRSIQNHNVNYLNIL
jgi:hypothetical protein